MISSFVDLFPSLILVVLRGIFTAMKHVSLSYGILMFPLFPTKKIRFRMIDPI